MEIKSYKKEADYSYSLGAFPTLELLKYHSNNLIKILIHSSFDNKDVLDKINQIVKDKSKIEINDKLINKLSDKENCFIIGIFYKYVDRLNGDANHLLLDNPSNMGNLGTIIRSALGFGFHDIAIIKPGVDIFNPKVIRGSMGAIFASNIQYFNSFEEYQKEYHNHRCYSFMLQAKTTLQEANFEKCLSTLIFGNEATGLDAKYLSINSLIITHSNAIDSLNLPTAVGIALYEFNKQIGK